MNKTELIKSIATKASLTNKSATAALDATIQSITEALKAGDKVSLPGFGTFEVRTRAARTTRNPRTGEAVEVAGIKVLTKAVPGVDMNELRGLGDQMKDKLGDCVVVLASDKDGRVNLIAMATDAAQKAGAHSGNIIKGIAGLVGGGGGGKPGMAQAGGKNPAGIQDALNKALELIKGQLQ